MKCPTCESERVIPRHSGKKRGATVGMITGAAAGALAAMRGAQFGIVAGAMLGPLGAVGGGVAGAAAGILFGGSAGAAIGSKAGYLVDEALLDNRWCLACGFTFRDEPERQKGER